MSASYFLYWGKASKDKKDSGAADYHLLPYHCLDVAAVGWWLLIVGGFFMSGKSHLNQ
ncbi:HD domain-containing protein [Oceanimonas sp. AH20CE76]|uniref:HD domain-containing protein n=1 Tax=Oceanimonas sp. AH20CE76 TaxID=2977120 RepID=UPI0031FF23F3